MKEIKINSASEIIYEFKTPKGLTVYLWVNPKKNNVFLTLNVKYGSNGIKFKCNDILYEVPSGTAHYLEHLKFHLKDVDASKLFYDLGCDCNAYTSYNETSYEVYCNSHLQEATNLLLDFVYDNYFTKNMVNNERNIILEESNQYKNDPDYIYYKKMLENFFQKSEYRNPVIGYADTIKNISLDDVSLVHNYFYRPENMFMVVTGNFDINKMHDIIIENEKKHEFKDIGKVKLIKTNEVEKFGEKYFVVEHPNCTHTQFKYTIKTSLKKFKGFTKREVLTALRIILYTNFGRISDFKENLLLNNIATSFSFNVSHDAGIIGVEFSSTTEREEELVKLLEEKLKNIEITKDDIKTLSNSIKKSRIIKFDNIYSVSSYIIGAIIDQNELDDYVYDLCNSITPKKVKEIYSCLDLSNHAIGILKQKKETN